MINRLRIAECMKAVIIALSYSPGVRADTHNAQVIQGNLGFSGTTDGKGNQRGPTIIPESREGIHLNLHTIKEGFDRKYQGREIDPKRKEEFKAAVLKASQGDLGVLNQFHRDGILTREEVNEISSRVNSDQLGYQNKHEHTKKHHMIEIPQHFSDAAHSLQKWPRDIDGPPTMVHHDDEYYPASYEKEPQRELNVKEPVKQPTSKITEPYVRPGSDRQREHKEKEQKEAMKLCSLAYEEALAKGLTEEQAKTNCLTAAHYPHIYNELLKKNIPPAEADQKAREILNNPRNIVGNHQDDLNILNSLFVREELHNPEPIGALGSRYPSGFLEDEAEKAKQREEMEQEAKKNLAEAAQQSITEDIMLHDQIDQHMQNAKEEIKKAEQLSQSTLESRAITGNIADPELQNEEVQEQARKKRHLYEQMDSHIPETAMITTLEKLKRDQHIDEEIMTKNKTLVEEFRMRQQQDEEQRAKDREIALKQLQEEEARLMDSPQEMTDIASQYAPFITKALEEREDTRQHEQAMAEAKLESIVEENGELAYKNVISLGGSETEATEARHKAEQLKGREIQEHIEQIMSEVTPVLEQQMSSKEASEHARHIATVQSANTVTGSSVEAINTEVMEKEKDPLRMARAEKISTIPDSASAVDLKNARIQLPLPIIEDAKALTDHDQALKNEMEEIRDEYRNTTHGPMGVATGLPEVKLEDGNVMTLSEGLQQIGVKEGKIILDQATYTSKSQNGDDMTPFKPHFTKDGVQYELTIEDGSVDLGTEGNRGVPMLKLGDEKIPLDGQNVQLQVDEGRAVFIPQEELNKWKRPKVHESMSTNTGDADPVETDLIRKFEEMEAATEAQNKMKVIKEHNPINGSDVYTFNPAYGVAKVLKETEIKDEFNNDKLNNSNLFGNQEQISLNMDDEQIEEDGTAEFLKQAEAKLLGDKMHEDTIKGSAQGMTESGISQGITESGISQGMTESGSAQGMTQTSSHGTTGETTEEITEGMTEGMTGEEAGGMTTETSHGMTEGMNTETSHGMTEGMTDHTFTETFQDEDNQPRIHGPSPITPKHPETGKIDPEMEAIASNQGELSALREEIITEEITEEDLILSEFTQMAESLGQMVGLSEKEMLKVISNLTPEDIREHANSMKSTDPTDQLRTNLYQKLQKSMPGADRKKFTDVLKGITSAIAKHKNVVNPNARPISTVPISPSGAYRDPITGQIKQARKPKEGEVEVLSRVQYDGSPTAVFQPPAQQQPLMNISGKNPKMIYEQSPGHSMGGTKPPGAAQAPGAAQPKGPMQPGINTPGGILPNPAVGSNYNNPLANPMNNPLTNPLANPLANPLNNPLANPLNNPLANPLNNPMANPLNNPMVNPLANPLNNPLANPLVNPMANPLVNPANNPPNDGSSPFTPDSLIDTSQHMKPGMQTNNKVAV
ncbi:hypothetical protein NUSPORA_02019 [Nucleospora cyclopteri]